MSKKFWFKHDANASQDTKCMRLIMTHGYEAYGVYWRIVEILCNAQGKIEKDLLPAYLPNVEPELLEYIVMQSELFACNRGVIESKRLSRQLSNKKCTSEARSRAAKQRWDRQRTDNQEEEVKANAMQKDMQLHSKSNAKQNANAMQTNILYSTSTSILNSSKKGDLKGESPLVDFIQKDFEQRYEQKAQTPYVGTDEDPEHIHKILSGLRQILDKSKMEVNPDSMQELYAITVENMPDFFNNPREGMSLKSWGKNWGRITEQAKHKTRNSHEYREAESKAISDYLRSL